MEVRVSAYRVNITRAVRVWKQMPSLERSPSSFDPNPIKNILEPLKEKLDEQSHGLKGQIR